MIIYGPITEAAAALIYLGVVSGLTLLGMLTACFIDFIRSKRK